MANMTTKTTEECTAYIKNYFNQETIPGSAIMLTSSWGSGKSYYVENELIKDIGQEHCVKVSLYGLKSLDDISKAIYIEMRSPQWTHGSEFGRKAALLGRTVLRGIFSYFKLNLTPQENELQEIYKSVNLEDKLIIFEDVERSGIPIVDILGYVNNLCEQDQAKVLLVVNEEEINKREKETGTYYRIKEKTVSDTIIFACPIIAPINNILKMFIVDEGKVSKAFAGISAEEVCSIMEDDARGHKENGHNFRSLIFACQKTQDLFNKANNHGILFTQDFFADCLYSIIAFSLKFKRGDDQNNQYSVWTSDMDSPGMLGHIKYPLLKDCYDFIVSQKFDHKLFEKTASEYSTIKQKDTNWRKLNAYDRYPFQDLVAALDGIEDLIQRNEFPLEDLGTLISKLYSIKAALKTETKIAEKVNKLLNSIKNQLEGATFSPSALYNKIVDAAFSTGGLDELKQEYGGYKLEISNIIVKKAVDELIGLTLRKEKISQFRKTIDAYESSSTNLFNLIRPQFTSRLEIGNLVDNLAQCSPNIVADFTDGFCRLYLRGGDWSAEEGLIGNRQEEIARKLYNARQIYFEDIVADDSSLSSQEQETIKKFQELVKKRCAGVILPIVNLSDEESTRIKELINSLKKKIEDTYIDIITKLQLKGFVDKLVKIL